MKYFEDIELQQLVTSDQSHLLSAEEIKNFASQWDPMPFHIDEEKAQQWHFGLIASGLHNMAICIRLGHSMVTEPTAVIAGLGWDQVRMPHPSRPGDRLRLRSWIVDKRLSKSNPERGIVTFKMELINQNDELILHFLTRSLIACRPVA